MNIVEFRKQRDCEFFAKKQRVKLLTCITAGSQV